MTDCPVYHPDAKESDAIRALRERDVDSIPPRPEESDPMWTLARLLASPTIASKSWIVRQYDSTVRASTVVGPGPADAAVVMLRGTRRALSLKTDCNGRYVYLDPRLGGRIAVVEAAQERRLHRRPADGDHELPQLREPAEAGGVLPVP